jgi:hypothetical protein
LYETFRVSSYRVSINLPSVISCKILEKAPNTNKSMEGLNGSRDKKNPKKPSSAHEGHAEG